MTVDCPIECVRSACPTPDFLEKHSSFVLTISAAFFTFLGGMFSYFLRSRCKIIKTPCISCDRDVLTPQDIEIMSNKKDEGHSGA